MAKVKYQTVDTQTLEGLIKAEKLFNNGWKIGSVGFTTIQFWQKGGKPNEVQKSIVGK